MKNYIFFLLFFCSIDLKAQFDQNSTTLSSYLKSKFPYGKVRENNCDSQFAGVFYIGFQIAASGKCNNKHCFGLKNQKLLLVFNELFNDDVYFISSFAKKMQGKMVYQPVYYSYYSCLRNNELDTTNNEECDIYINAILMLSKSNKKIKESLTNGYPMNTKKYFEGVMLSPCIIDADPNNPIRTKM